MSEYPRFGPGVLGKEEYERQLAEAKESDGGRFGPALRRPKAINVPASVSKPSNEPPTPPVEGPSEPYAALSVRELSELLETDAGLAEPILEAELARPEGARKSALREVAKAERTKDEPRAAVLDRIEALIEELG